MNILNEIKLAFPFFWRKDLKINYKQVLMPLDSVKYYVDDVLQKEINRGGTVYLSQGTFYVKDTITLKDNAVISGESCLQWGWWDEEW